MRTFTTILTTFFMCLILSLGMSCENKKRSTGEYAAPPEFVICNDSLSDLPLTINEPWLLENLPAFCELTQENWIENSLSIIEPFEPSFKYYKIGEILDGPPFYCRIAPNEIKGWIVNLNAMDNAKKATEVVYSNSEGFMGKELTIGELLELEMKQTSLYSKDTIIQVSY